MRSELVAEFEANINGGLIATDAVGEEVLVKFGSQVGVDLVGDGVVDLEVAVELGGGLELGVLGGLVVVTELDVDGVLHESLVVDSCAVLVTGEVCGDLGEVLPALVVPLRTEGDLVVCSLGELGGRGGPVVSLGAAAVSGESLELVDLLEHFTADTSFPLVTAEDEVSLDIEGLVLARLVGHVNLSLW